MKNISILKNKIQEYDWGSYTAISELLGESSPSDTPQAELWMGAHPKAASAVEENGKCLPLNELIREYPEDILGKSTAKKFDNRLPYLFKVLAAAKPLSIQAHPNRLQAEEGFEKESKRGISLNAPDRSYKDKNHKPECICAITPFLALNGFRKIPDILLLSEKISITGLEKELRELRNNPNSQGLRIFFNSVMTLDTERKKAVISHAIKNAEKFSDDPVFQWIIRLYHEYPSDIGVLSPLWLNLICLKLGEAMFLPAGSLHAYLDGVGIELMANSDNVLRGGLTPKHVDVSELLQILNFEAKDVNILLPEKISDYESVYKTPAEEFLLSVVSIKDKAEFFNKSVEILLCTEGKGIIHNIEKNHKVDISKGTSVIIPAAAHNYLIQGNLTLYKASVP